jgi:hypothetical protein
MSNRGPRWSHHQNGSYQLVTFVERGTVRRLGDLMMVRWRVHKFFRRWRVEITREGFAVELGHGDTVHAAKHLAVRAAILFGHCFEDGP